MKTIAYDGEIRINTKIDSSGISSGINKIKSAFGSIVSSLSVFSLMQKGVDLVTGSIDAALDRGDTMDQFDRTMNKLVGDSTKVNQALDSLKDITTGTAYSLDTAAKATQNFVTRGMDLEDATQQVGIWADAVAFYGKGTNEEFANVTDALGEMLTKGKVDMDQLDRLFDVGIDAVGMYAQAVGRSSAEVQDDLSYGRISAEDFVTTVSNAMETGAGGVQKLAGAAKEAGASWSGTIANMRTAVTRGVLGIIESLDEGLQAANLPGIKEMISGIGSTIEEVLGKASGMIPDLIQTAKGIYDEFQPVISSLGDVISGVIDTVQQKLPEIISAGKELYNAVAPDLKNLVTTIGDLLGGAIKTVIDMLPGAIQTAANLYNTIKPLAPLILGVTAAVKGWQAFRTAQTWLGDIGKKLTETADKIKKFTDQEAGLVSILGQAGTKATNASKLFTTAGKATDEMSKTATKATNATGALAKALGFLTSPTGMVVSLIGGAAISLGTLAINFLTTSEDAERLTQKIEEATQAMNDSKEAFDDTRTSVLDADAANESSLANYQALYDELMTLVDANGKVKEGYEDRVDYINGELNSAFGTNLERIGEEIQGVQELKQNWDDLLEKQKAGLKQEAYQSIYSNAQTQKQSLEEQMRAMEPELQRLQGIVSELEEEYAQNGGSAELNVELGGNRAELERVTQAYNDLRSQYEAYTRQEALYTQGSAQISAGNYSGAISSFEQIDAVLLYTAAAGASLENLKQQATDAYTAYASTARLTSWGATDAQKYADALAYAEATTAEYARKTGKTINGLVVGFDENGNAVVKSVQQIRMEMNDQATQGAIELAGRLNDAGVEVSDAFIMALDEKSSEVQDAAVSVLQRLSTATEDQKPELYALLYSLGVEFDDNLKAGLADNVHVVEQAGSDVITGFTDAAGNRIEEVTPEFCQMLVDMGIAGKDQMDTYMRTHNIEAPAMNEISTEQQSANAVQNVQNYMDSHRVSIRTVVESPNWQQAVNQWQQTANKLHVSIPVAGQIISPQAGPVRHANGGLITQPHLGIVGEDGPEAIIPLSPSRRSRGLELWQQAGQWLGVKLHAAGAIVSRMQPVSYPPILRNAEAQAQRMILQSRLNTDAIRQACKEGCESAVLAVAVENRVQAVFNPKTAAKEMADYTDAILGDKTRRVKRYAE